MKAHATGIAKLQGTIAFELATAKQFSEHNLGSSWDSEFNTFATQIMGVIQYFVGVYTPLVFFTVVSQRRGSPIQSLEQSTNSQ
jgi:hypothetical protein